MREIAWRLEQIDFREAQEFRLSAMLHRGIELPAPEQEQEQAKAPEFTDQERAVIQKNKEEFIKRKVQEINA